MSSRALFDRYASQLKFLKANDLLKNTHLRYDDTYICPICLRQFSPDDLSHEAANQLTKEHAPPGAAGGQAVALLCKQCNNESGSAYDKHLIERLLDIDRSKFVPGTSMDGKLVHRNGISVTSTIKVDSDGIPHLDIPSKRNSPVALNNFADAVNASPEVEFDPRMISDGRKMELSLLKAAYVLAFARFGYWFLLDIVYNKLRKQLLNPTVEIYPEGFVLDRVDAADLDGIYLLTNSLAEGIFVVFTVATAAGTVHRYGVHLPIPMSMPEKSVSVFARLLIRSGKLLPLEVDFLLDSHNINQLFNWFQDVRFSKIGLNAYRNTLGNLLALKYPIAKVGYKLDLAMNIRYSPEYSKEFLLRSSEVFNPAIVDRKFSHNIQPIVNRLIRGGLGDNEEEMFIYIRRYFPILPYEKKLSARMNVLFSKSFL